MKWNSADLPRNTKWWSMETCVGCGIIGFSPSMGGRDLCPSCDVGNPQKEIDNTLSAIQMRHTMQAMIRSFILKKDGLQSPELEDREFERAQQMMPKIVQKMRNQMKMKLRNH